MIKDKEIFSLHTTMNDNAQKGLVTALGRHAYTTSARYAHCEHVAASINLSTLHKHYNKWIEDCVSSDDHDYISLGTSKIW